MSKVNTKHRGVNGSQDCAVCYQVMRNFEKARPLTKKQSHHYKLNEAIIDARAQTEIAGTQLQLARQGTLDEVR